MLTTLIVVTLFTPIKTSVQNAVDTRFKAPARVIDPAVASSMEALEALGALIKLNQSGGLTSSEYEDKKSQLLARA